MEPAIPHDNSSDPGSRSAPSVAAGYGLAIAAFAAALSLTLFIRYASGNPTFFSFYIAIFVSVWFGGRGPGWLATALASSFPARGSWFWPCVGSRGRDFRHCFWRRQRNGDYRRDARFSVSRFGSAVALRLASFVLWDSIGPLERLRSL